MGLLDIFTEKQPCNICETPKNNLLLNTIYDGKICGDCLHKVGFDGDITTLSCKNALQRCLLYDDLKRQGKLNQMPPFPFMTVEEHEMFKRQSKYINTPKYKKLMDKYYDDLTKIDNLWSVLYNLNDFNGKKAIEYEKICINHINIFKQIYEEFCVPNNTIEFTCVPAYKRLCMLYEKQKRYNEATIVCLDAIQHNAPNEYGDGGSGKIYARLARMAKKAGLLEDPSIKPLITQKG